MKFGGLKCNLEKVFGLKMQFYESWVVKMQFGKILGKKSRLESFGGWNCIFKKLSQNVILQKFKG